MVTEVGVAEFKRRFSEMMDRVVQHQERVVVRRRGGHAAMLAPLDPSCAEALGHAEPRRGILAAAGAWQDYPDVDDLLTELRARRDGALDRDVADLP